VWAYRTCNGRFDVLQCLSHATNLIADRFQFTGSEVADNEVGFQHFGFLDGVNTINGFAADLKSRLVLKGRVYAPPDAVAVIYDENLFGAFVC
jgi:hypothetical protein